MQKLLLSIPEPCHENWQQMTPTEQGRFCNACAKEVVDFSSMTDIQVLNYFSALTHQKVCGRALPEQLDRIIGRPETPKKRLFWYWNYIVMFFMLFTKGNAAKAQGGIKPVTEVSPAKPNDVRGEMIARVPASRVVTGKVTDIAGNPVSFATIKVKGTNIGVAADANGVYSIRVNSTQGLEISAAGFKTLEVSEIKTSILNSVLETSVSMDLGIVVTVFGNTDYYEASRDFTKRVAVLKVKDEETGKALPNVSVVINADTVVTDKKGIYKIKGINNDKKYFIRLNAEGYETAEFTIGTYDFKDRKKEWEILLRKKPAELVKSEASLKLGKEATVRLRCENGIGIGAGAIYVVDGVITKNAADINPDDIDNVFVLQAPGAAALFGIDGVNGAILITTKKRVVNLDTVEIKSFGLTKGVVKINETRTSTVLGGMVKGIQVKATVADSLKLLVNKMIGAIKVYPNPVNRGEQLNLSLKLKQTGLHQMQITDAGGRIVLKKQFNAVSKNYTGKILTDIKWSSGTYYISITNYKDQLVNSSFIVR